MKKQPKQSAYPKGHLCNPAFKWVPSEYTDIRKTIKRAMAEQKKGEAKCKQ